MTASFKIDGVELAQIKPVKGAGGAGMRAATLTQPWAGLVAAKLKPIENRGRPMVKREDFGHPFAIHASREINEDVYPRIRDIAPELWDGATLNTELLWWRLSRITSAVIAVATIDHVILPVTHRQRTPIAGMVAAEDVALKPEDLRWWFREQYGYVLRDVQALATPVPCRGWQGFWTLPADVERAVRNQLAEAAPCST